MKLIACLGYSLKEDNSVHPILENRLRDSVNMCVKNNESTLILMGGAYYKDTKERRISQASAMKKFLDENFKEELENIKIIVEENTTSTIEQLCYLRELIDSGEFKLKYSDLVLVASKFFIERVKLYSEYIFDTNTEENKLKEAQIWLKDYKRGDYKEILNRQKVFQEQIQKGKINYPAS